jgi:UDP-galactose transporter B1
MEKILKLPYQKISSLVFWKVAATSAIASPIGYSALKYVSYPLMVLTKSSKPLPVMLVGILFYKKKYSWYKYVSVLQLCLGIYLFTLNSKNKNDSKNSNESSVEQYFNISFGMFLLMINLFLDGYTNNEQDHVFIEHSATSLEMMKNTNFWQSIFYFTYLFVTFIIFQEKSELSKAMNILQKSDEISRDVLIFCSCAAFGQVLIFSVIKEFGSLVWISISITRQLFTILLSVFAFNHQLKMTQWSGIIFVFSGLILEIFFSYNNKDHQIDDDFDDSPMISTTTKTRRPDTPRKIKSIKSLVDVEENKVQISPIKKIKSKKFE